MSTNDTTVVLNSGWQIKCKEAELQMFNGYVMVRGTKIDHGQLLMISCPSGEVWYE